MSFLASILSLSISAGFHPGPPVFIEIDAGRAEVKISLSAERACWLDWMNVEGPLPAPDFDPSITERLVVAASRLLKEERGLDLELDGEKVVFTVDQVSLLEMFGAGNAEPALRIDLTARNLVETPPSELSLTWGLFDRIEDPAERILPVLIEANGDFDLLRGTEANPTVRWTLGAEQPLETRAPNGSANPSPPYPVEAAAPRLAGSRRLRAPLLLCSAALLGVGLFVAARARRAGAAIALGVLTAASGTGFVVTSRADDVNRLEEAEALILFEKLHQAVYGAFDASSESEIYDRLAACVHGSVLDTLYSDILRGLVLEDDGGAVCRIESLYDNQGTLVNPDLIASGDADLSLDGFAVEYSWSVRGRVIHFGHEHQRENRYVARYGIRPVAGAWRITSFEALEHKRIGESR